MMVRRSSSLDASMMLSGKLNGNVVVTGAEQHERGEHAGEAAWVWPIIAVYG